MVTGGLLNHLADPDAAVAVADQGAHRGGGQVEEVGLADDADLDGGVQGDGHRVDGHKICDLQIGAIGEHLFLSWPSYPKPPHQKRPNSPTTSPSRTAYTTSAPASAPPIPGEPAGIPGRAMPSMSGRSVSSRSMAAAGTWPSTK